MRVLSVGRYGRGSPGLVSSWPKSQTAAAKKWAAAGAGACYHAAPALWAGVHGRLPASCPGRRRVVRVAGRSRRQHRRPRGRRQRPPPGRASFRQAFPRAKGWGPPRARSCGWSDWRTIGQKGPGPLQRFDCLHLLFSPHILISVNHSQPPLPPANLARSGLDFG